MRSGTLAALILVAGVVEAQEPEPESYRTDHYRGPVPESLSGATVLDDEAAHALWEEGRAVFIDVLPQAPKPKGLPEGTIWRDKPRHSIPGAIWLPDVGYGGLAPQMDGYFRENLEKATGGDAAAPVVFFCLAECWMSWNAAKRAHDEYGYSAVHWYPEGTDGWTFNDWPVEEVKPEPRPE